MFEISEIHESNRKNLKTLIIHPDDPTTDFLKPIYKPIKNKTVIIGGSHKSELMHLIPQFDKIILMGHGSPSGLYAIGVWWDCSEYVIDASFVPYLKGNPNNIYIWCDADQFVECHGLSGFYSGNFISGKIESLQVGVIGADQSDIEESNNAFSEILSRNINEDNETIYKRVREEYGKLAKRNCIVRYNCQRLYYR